jgi:hypothetical protein
MLCGAAPISASSGRTDRHRLNRGGDRQANYALRTIAVSRFDKDPKTRDYVDRRTAQGLSKREILRCLKRYAPARCSPTCKPLYETRQSLPASTRPAADYLRLKGRWGPGLSLRRGLIRWDQA